MLRRQKLKSSRPNNNNMVKNEYVNQKNYYYSTG